jgi:hypothetical protein
MLYSGKLSITLSGRNERKKKRNLMGGLEVGETLFCLL